MIHANVIAYGSCTNVMYGFAQKSVYHKASVKEYMLKTKSDGTSQFSIYGAVSHKWEPWGK